MGVLSRRWRLHAQRRSIVVYAERQSRQVGYVAFWHLNLEGAAECIELRIVKQIRRCTDWRERDVRFVHNLLEVSYRHIAHDGGDDLAQCGTVSNPVSIGDEALVS